VISKGDDPSTNVAGWVKAWLVEKLKGVEDRW
jgi:hypothetical protein